MLYVNTRLERTLIDRTWGTDGIIRYNCHGEVGIEDLIGTLRETVADERYAETTASLWDLRGADYPIDQSQHDAAAPIFKTILGQPGRIRRTAWIVEYKTSMAIIELYFKRHNLPQEWQTFHQYEEGEAWCRGATMNLA